jgi:dethiobiotin synthetase
MDIKSEEAAWLSLEYLRNAALELEGLVLDAKSKARRAKYEHALAVVNLENANTTQKVPATVRKEHALANDAVQKALKEADEADAKCDVKKEHIMLFKATARDRS